MELRIANRIFTSFEEFRLQLRYDSLASTLDFDGVFNPGNEFHRRIFRPYNYEKYEVLFNRNVIQTGVLLNRSFSLSSQEQVVAVSGYSLPGVLQDCTPAKSSYPLQFNGLNLIEIASQLIQPFSLGISIDERIQAEAAQPYFETEMADSQTIQDYLQTLAQQRNIVITHDSAGNVLFTRARTDQPPIQHFENGISGIKIDLSTNGQQSHQVIHVLGSPELEDDNGLEAFVTNPFVNRFRTLTVNQTSGADEGIEAAAINAIAQQFKNTRLTISMDRTTWNNGQLVSPNNIITVRAPELFLFNRTKFFVEAVTIERKAAEETASLSCVLPNVYDGTLPDNFFAV